VNREELLELVYDHLENGNRNKYSNLYKSDLWIEIVSHTSYLKNQELHYQHRLWHFLTSSSNDSRCRHCNKLTGWIRETPIQYCCNQCSITHTLPYKLETNNKRYGGNSPAASPTVISKMEQTMYDRHGVTNISKSSKIKEKKRIKSQEKFGTDNPSQAQEIKDKLSDIALSKSPDERAEIMKKAIKSSKLKKEYTLPSGEIVLVQGAEPMAIDYLLTQYDEADLLIGTSNTPHLHYIDKIGKERRYYPDLYVKSTNTIFEVKTDFIFYRDVDNNFRKAEAARSAGYNFKWLFKEGKNIVEYDNYGT
jgi:hypothetical protein